MSVEKIAAIKAKRLAKKRTTIKVDDDLEAGVLVRDKTLGLEEYKSILIICVYKYCTCLYLQVHTCIWIGSTLSVGYGARCMHHIIMVTTYRKNI